MAEGKSKYLQTVFDPPSALFLQASENAIHFLWRIISGCISKNCFALLKVAGAVH